MCEFDTGHNRRGNHWVAKKVLLDCWNIWGCAEIVDGNRGYVLSVSTCTCRVSIWIFFLCLKWKYSKAAAVLKLRKFVCEYRCRGFLWRTRLCPCDIEFSINYSEIVINNLVTWSESNIWSAASVWLGNGGYQQRKIASHVCF